MLASFTSMREGMSRRQAEVWDECGERVRWHPRFKASGTVAPSRQRDRRSGRIEAYSEVTLGLDR
jgi:hypothetical protein